MVFGVKYMKEIGGYIEFEYFHGNMLHGDGLKLDCGRSCLAYLFETKKISKLALPSFMCDAVFELCDRYEVHMDFYEVGYNLKPKALQIDEDEYLYLVNYYGQLSSKDIRHYREMYPNVIVDNTQAYFAEPVDDVDTLYTCRKYFGVPDGGILFTGAKRESDLPRSESFDKMTYLMGRFERTASEFYSQSALNNDRFIGQPVQRMSKLTENLLRGLDYDRIRRTREKNFGYLDEAFASINRLEITAPAGPFAYPLLIDHNAAEIRKKLASEKIYIPVLWPNVLEDREENSIDHDLALNILPLPCDQRYGLEEMEYLKKKIASML